MEVRKGYKQTEIGVIPKDWDLKPLSGIGNFRTGPFGTLLKANEYYAVEGVPLVAVKDIGEGKLNFNDETPLVPLSVVRRLPEYVLNSGDIIFGRKGNVNRTAIVQESQAGCFLGSDGIRARLSKICHPQFVIYQLQSKYIQAWLLQNATGTTMPSMNQSILRRLFLAFPPTLAEQEAIAEALSDADALIESLETLLAKKRQVKQGAMSELLTGKRRVVESGKWEVKTIGEVGYKFLNGGTPSTKNEEYWKGNIPWITGADFIDQKVADIRRFITSDAVNNSATNVVEKGNLLVVTRTGVGKIAIAPFDLAISQDITGVYLKKEYMLPEFLYSYFSYNTGSLRNLNQGTSISGITRDTLISLPVPVPSISEQSAIAEILSDMDEEILALEGKLSKARAVKAGMMSALLTGRVRLV